MDLLGHRVHFDDYEHATENAVSAHIADLDAFVSSMHIDPSVAIVAVA